MAESFPQREHEQVLRLLKQYGWNATSFQVLESGFRYWFDPKGDACVAYVDTGGAWVAAGGPITSRERVAEVVASFEAAARAQGRRVCFFATEKRFSELVPVEAMLIGEQPTWDPNRWEETLRSSRSLREQLRRARARGVTVRRVGPEELRDVSHPTRRAVDKLLARWLASRRMAPMGFLVQLSPYEYAEERRAFVGELNGEVVCFLSAVPVFAREGWLLQHVVRDPRAPNGSAELMVDAAMRAAASEGRRYVTLGLAPLSGELEPWLRAARFWGSALFDFEGLRAFKAKLRPHAWDPIHLAWPSRTSTLWPVYGALRAFAQGSFIRFGLATLLRRADLLVRLLALLLIPWTALLALPFNTHRFPSRGIQWAWVVFDVGLTGALLELVRRWRSWLAGLLGGVVALDACLTAWQAVAYNAPRASGRLDWAIIAAAVLAPSTAACLLGWAWRHPPPAYS
ncbi:MAG: phosphatidylglycerol lysyltransferase domain-containing protein [Hyalangium sp.]|uniref:phosphatidylglycerol lysyltransferase domain-containing protein n=1 Tax=Hyalangium sp. TaxID=2028555 RepID=UPI00389B0205